MPSHIELVAGKHYSGASDRSIAALPFQPQHTALAIKIVMMKNLGSSKQIVTISYKKWHRKCILL
jgi:hypothetical protein